MEKLLKPKDLSVNFDDANAEKIFKFWLPTVEDFIEVLVEAQPAAARENFNKKRIIISCLSPDFYAYVKEAQTYERVVEILKQTSVRTKNHVYARHLLVSRRQGADETIADYLQALKKLSKDCTFAAVSAQQYKEQLIRDSFINGLSSAFIRQRLLENDELSLNRAFELADNLDRAYRYATSLESNQAAATAVPPENHTEVQMDLAAATSKYVKRGSCYFCGVSIHLNRKLCPAKDTICHGCGKRGHFVKVCRKTNEEKFNAASSSMSTESNPQCNRNEKSS